MSSRLSRRNHAFDLLRILFATAVLLAHAPALIDGNDSREVGYRFTHSMSLGAMSVDGFFLLSGFLIVQSWQRERYLLSFLQKRILRIVPGYLVAAIVSTVVVGLLAPADPKFFHHLGGRYVASLLCLNDPRTPPVFRGFHFAKVNGSMWTIAYEFHCYLLVPLCGFLGILRRRFAWLAVTALLWLVAGCAAIQNHLTWRRFYFVTGDPGDVYGFTAAFFVGGCFYLFRDRIRFTRVYAGVAAIVLVVVLRVRHDHFESALIVFGAYLLFYLGERQRNGLTWMNHIPDISYGIYLYGWPIESLWIWFHRGSPWIAFFVSALLSFLFGWASWHFVERPMLTLKRKPTARLPPA